MGVQPNAVLKDDKASDINNFRTAVLMNKADFVIALFGEKYKQWNTAMDASYAIAKGKPLIIIRPESLHHPLKELSNKANITVETVNQAIKAFPIYLKQNKKKACRSGLTARSTSFYETYIFSLIASTVCLSQAVTSLMSISLAAA